MSDQLHGESEFRAELAALINKYSFENGSNTPDFILAKFISDCLLAFDTATIDRDRWYRSILPTSEQDELLHRL